MIFANVTYLFFLYMSVECEFLRWSQEEIVSHRHNSSRGGDWEIIWVFVPALYSLMLLGKSEKSASKSSKKQQGGLGILIAFVLLNFFFTIFIGLIFNHCLAGGNLREIVTALYIFIVGMMVGVPTKAPVFTVNNTEIKLAHTTAKELIDEGFDIYIRKDENFRSDYNELISSGSFKKYSADRSVYVEKGFRRNDAAVEYSPYLLAKDGVVIGAVWFYGDDNKDIILENCKVIHIELNEDSIKAIRKNSIRCKLNGLDLMAPLKPEDLKKTFRNKLWLAPDNPKDISEMHYGIRWPASNDSLEHLFWNTYYSSIDFDGNNMTKFQISTQVAKDTNFL